MKKNLERSQHVVPADIEAAWKVLVPNGDTSITKAALWERLGHYRPHTEIKTVNHLAGSGSMTLDKLTKLLWKDDQPRLPCDMWAAAWALLDSHDRGAVPLEHLLHLLADIPGCDKLDEQDLRVVRLLLDLGPEEEAITSKSWEQLGSWAPRVEELTPVQRRMLAARAAAADKAGGGGGEKQFGRMATAGRRTMAPQR